MNFCKFSIFIECYQNLKSMVSKYMKKDTIVCPAHDWGVKDVLLKQKKWFSVEIKQERIPALKYLAIYEKSPVQAIRYVGEIKEIRPYKDTKSYEIILKDAQKITVIC